MHVLIIASWYPTAHNPLSGIFFQQRAQALARQGCQVSVAVADVCLRTKGKTLGITRTVVEGVAEYRCVQRNATPFWEKGIAYQQIRAIRRIYQKVCQEQGKPDVIHLESARLALAAVELAQKENIPLTYTEHFSGMIQARPGSFREKCMYLAAEKAAHTFCLSTFVKNRVNPPEDRFSYLPNAIRFSEFSLAEPAEPFTFCALGGLQPVKGYDLLLQAFRLVQDHYPHTRLVIGGMGNQWELLHGLREQLQLTETVTFTGTVIPEKRNDFYHEASAFVCSSHIETFSIVTVEALACGLPVVATKCGGPEDFIKETNGVLVEKNSVEALAAGMMQLLEKKERYCPAQIRQDAFSRYEESVVVEKQIACFQRLLQE